MSLAAGTRLGPYEVLALIGAGGMGEVYKARDTRLDRTVAIKILPAAISSDPDRRARFEREARAISHLNHPHICTLHDVGREGEIDYLVMEYLEGETLAQRLARVGSRTAGGATRTPPAPSSATPRVAGSAAIGHGRRGAPLTLDETLRVGTELAEALAAAHKAGIVHRDLKPGNVMLTPTGVKVLDFGLARLQIAAAASGESFIATHTVDPLTDAGTRLGTIPYMAPEQVEGRDADARSDVFALGTILYEMATGERAFDGETAASIVAAILDREPPAVTTIQPRTPRAFEHVVTTCLAKDPEARWQAASDVARELRWIADEARTAAHSLAGAAPTEPLPATRRDRLRRTLPLATGLALMVAAATPVVWFLRPVPPWVSFAGISVQVLPAEELNSGAFVTDFMPTAGGSRTALTWTPDGQALVFVGRRRGVQQLYVRRLDVAEARPLAGTEDAQVPAVSADGQWVAFWAGRAIRKVPLGGGPVMDLATGLTYPPRGLVWDARGRVFFGRDDGRIWQIPPEGVPAAVTTVRKGELSHVLPWPLPAGQALLYTVKKRMFSSGDEEVVAQTLATGERALLVKDATDGRYVPTGHLVFLRRGALYAVPFDAARLKVLGAEVPLLDAVAQASSAINSEDITGAGQFAVSATGVLAWVRGLVVPYPNTRLVTVDRHGRVTPLPAPLRAYPPNVRVSPDGGRLAVCIQTLTEVGRWVYDLGRGSLTPLSTAGETGWMLWSPDGRDLVFDQIEGGRPLVARQSADGTAPPQVLVSGLLYPSSSTPDGRTLAAVSIDYDLLIATLENGKATVQKLWHTAEEENWPEFSRDGRWLAYGSTVSGRFEVYVRSYPALGPAEPVSIDGGGSPAWHPNGRELFFLSLPDQAGKRQMMVADFTPGSPPGVGHRRPLFEFDDRDVRFGGTPVRSYDVAPDGQRFYGVQWRTPPPPPVVTHINLMFNWFEELKAKVPVK